MQKTPLYLFFGLLWLLSGCMDADTRKIGISMGAGNAARWEEELGYMVERANMLHLNTSVRFRKNGSSELQAQDCKELIDSGIGVLILLPRDASNIHEILTYAHKNKVKVIIYAKAVTESNIDGFIGYNLYKIGQAQGKYIADNVQNGHIAILKGLKNGFNCRLLYYGAMNKLQPLLGDKGSKVILDEFTEWSPAKAKELLAAAVADNDGKLDAVLAQNDVLAGAAAEVVAELGLQNRVIIVGMDAELPALQRMVQHRQDATVYMDLKPLAYAAIDSAYYMLAPNIENTYEQQTGDGLKMHSHLLDGKLVTRETMDAVLFKPGHVSRQAVYGQ